MGRMILVGDGLDSPFGVLAASGPLGKATRHCVVDGRVSAPEGLSFDSPDRGPVVSLFGGPTVTFHQDSTGAITAWAPGAQRGGHVGRTPRQIHAFGRVGGRKFAGSVDSNGSMNVFELIPGQGVADYTLSKLPKLPGGRPSRYDCDVSVRAIFEAEGGLAVAGQEQVFTRRPADGKWEDLWSYAEFAADDNPGFIHAGSAYRDGVALATQRGIVVGESDRGWRRVEGSPDHVVALATTSDGRLFFSATAPRSSDSTLFWFDGANVRRVKDMSGFEVSGMAFAHRHLVTWGERRQRHHYPVEVMKI